jgi:hypothetical protein
MAVMQHPQAGAHDQMGEVHPLHTTSVSAGEHNLLWLVLHSAMRLGYRSLTELRRSVEVMTDVERAGRREQCNCPVCGYGAIAALFRPVDVGWEARDGRETEEPDDGETRDHAYGTCCELGSL